MWNGFMKSFKVYTNPLGIVADKVRVMADAAIAPRWIVKRAPDMWVHGDELTDWAIARGFQTISANESTG